MKKKMAIAICAHHKPWLVMSTMITLAMQDYQDFDIYFIYQSGDGSCPKKNSYDEYFQLAGKYGGFTQLSPYDQRVRRITEGATKFKNVYTLEFENDHALDSGAWYKFIKTGHWKEYEHMFFIQEGTILTRSSVVRAVLDFAKDAGVEFISSGHEKRRLPREVLLSSNAREKNSNEIDAYHDRKLNEVFAVFCRDPEFKHVFDSWGSDFEIETQNHVPDVMDSVSRKALRSVKRLNPGFLLSKTIYVNTIRRVLRDVVNSCHENKKVIFHKDNGVEWFGCSCQHFVSLNFLERFSKKIEEYNLYDSLEIPFCAGALEVVWGLLPSWLGFDKWFFDGMHRVRKSFTTYKREDDPIGMCFYLNSYFRGKIVVAPEGDFLRIKELSRDFKFVKDILGQEYFTKEMKWL